MEMNSTGLLIDDGFLAHETGPNHPERPDRLRAIGQALGESGLLDACRRLPTRIASDDELRLVHTRAYLRRLKAACEAGTQFIDSPDSAICPASYDVARLAAGSVLAAVDAVVAGEVKNAFCAVRPPGHHCERSESMGFCLLSNVAIAAQYLAARHDFGRIAILDWDVHHGNGTQHVFEDTSSVLFCSIHGHPDQVYPGMGLASERGIGEGVGATLNVPMFPGAGDKEYQRAFDEIILPVLRDYKPEFVLISAGFDAHGRDPLAPMMLESGSYSWMTDRVLDVANQFADGRLISVLEGGYDLQALSESVCQHVERLIPG